MENKTTEFKPGMLVIYCEVWPVYRIILIDTVKSVGKRFITTSNGKFRLNGETTNKVYKWRAIRPLTKKSYEQAEKENVYGLHLALGQVLPE